MYHHMIRYLSAHLGSSCCWALAGSRQPAAASSERRATDCSDGQVTALYKPPALTPRSRSQVCSSPVQSWSRCSLSRRQTKVPSPVEVQVRLPPHPAPSSLPPHTTTLPPHTACCNSVVLSTHTLTLDTPQSTGNPQSHPIPIPPDSCSSSIEHHPPPLSRLNSNTTFFSSRSLNFLPASTDLHLFPTLSQSVSQSVHLSLSPSPHSQPLPQAGTLCCCLPFSIPPRARPPRLCPHHFRQQRSAAPTDPDPTHPTPIVFLSLATASWPNRRPNLPDNPISTYRPLLVVTSTRPPPETT